MRNALAGWKAAASAAVFPSGYSRTTVGLFATRLTDSGQKRRSFTPGLKRPNGRFTQKTALALRPVCQARGPLRGATVD